MLFEGKNAIFTNYTYRSNLFEEVFLQLLGMTVRLTSTTEEILSEAKNHGCDLVVIAVDDLRVFLKGEEGHNIHDLCGVVELVRGARETLAQTPFLLVGKNPPTVDEAACLKAANTSYYQLPFRRADFNAAVEALVK